MYKSVRIQNFRGFDKLSVSDLTRVNIVVGANNVGKTAVLEAIALLGSVGQAEVADYLNFARALPRPYRGSRTVFNSLFHQFDVAEAAWVEAVNHSGSTDRVEIEATVPEGSSYPTENGDVEHPPNEQEELPPERELLRLRWRIGDIAVAGSVHLVPRRMSSGTVTNRVDFRSETDSRWPRATFLPTRTRGAADDPAEQFTELVQSGHEETLVRALRLIDARIVGAGLLLYEGETMVHADVGSKRKMPLGLLGDGAARMCTIAMSIGSAAGGLAAIDELDTGIYYAALPDAWKLVGAAAREFGTQVFATTHSYECMTAAYEAFADHPEDFSMHRLERVNGEIVCKSFGHRLLGNALQMGLEVR